MAISPGFFRKTRTTQLTQACAKRKRNFNGGSWNDEGMEGGNRSNAGSFWHQVRKKPELWAEKSDNNSQLRFPVKKEIRVRCWIDIDGGKFFGPGRGELFQFIGEKGKNLQGS